MSIPTTLDPSVATVDVTAPEGINVIIGNLMYSTFYGIAAGGATPTGVSFQSGDKVGIWPEYVTWECFLAYDKRSKGAGTLPNQADVLGTIVDDDVARITAKMKAYANWDIPIGATTTILVVYQIRATLA